jgi:hypothetical protein
MAFLPPPKSLNINPMHNFQPGDADLPPSLSNVFDNLMGNEYLIRGQKNGTYSFSTPIYNPGTGQPETYYDAYNVAIGDWIASDAAGYIWKITQVYNVTDAPNPGNNTGSGIFYAVISDVDYYNAGLAPGGTFNGGPKFVDQTAILFTVDENGFPVFTPQDTYSLSANFVGSVIGRFQFINTYNQYVSIYQVDVSGTMAVGDPVYFDTVTNLYKPSYGIGDVMTVKNTLGIVTSVGVPT